MNHKNKSEFEVSKIDRFLKLAKTPPDETLLRRYFGICSGDEIESPLTGTERRWITANLHANPNWQTKWTELEKEFGASVDWKAEPRTSLKPSVKTVRQKRIFSEFFGFILPAPAFRFAAVAVLGFIVLYGGLHLVGNATLTETYQLASISDYEDILSETVRGKISIDNYSRGISALLAAPSDWFGLFPHYDLSRVDNVIHHLHTAFQDSEDEFQKAEIAFFLAKAYLMKNDLDRAKIWLNEVLAQSVADYREEAVDLLKKIATEIQRSQSEN